MARPSHQTPPLRSAEGHARGRHTPARPVSALLPPAFALPTHAEEDVIPQDQAGRAAGYELAPHQKSVRQAAWFGLFDIIEMRPPLRAILQQPLETRQVFSGVLMTRISRIPPSINIERG